MRDGIALIEGCIAGAPRCGDVAKPDDDLGCCCARRGTNGAVLPEDALRARGCRCALSRGVRGLVVRRCVEPLPPSRKALDGRAARARRWELLRDAEARRGDAIGAEPAGIGLSHSSRTSSSLRRW
jgi:hypothetical protein